MIIISNQKKTQNTISIHYIQAIFPLEIACNVAYFKFKVINLYGETLYHMKVKKLNMHKVKSKN